MIKNIDKNFLKKISDKKKLLDFINNYPEHSLMLIFLIALFINSLFFCILASKTFIMYSFYILTISFMALYFYNKDTLPLYVKAKNIYMYNKGEEKHVLNIYDDEYHIICKIPLHHNVYIFEDNDYLVVKRIHQYKPSKDCQKIYNTILMNMLYNIDKMLDKYFITNIYGKKIATISTNNKKFYYNISIGNTLYFDKTFISRKKEYTYDVITSIELMKQNIAVSIYFE